MATSDESGTGKVVTGTILLVVAFAGTEALLWHLGGLIAAIATPVAAFLWWLGYRLVTVPVHDDESANGTVHDDRERPARPRANEPHNW